MSSRNAALGAAKYEAESAFAETTPTTTAIRLLPVESLELSGMQQDMIDINPVVQYPHDGVQDIRGAMRPAFTLKLPLTGHGSAPSGALTATDLATLMAYHVGTLHSSNDGGTFTGGTAGSPTHSGMVLANQSLIRMGALNDGRGGGHWFVVNAEAGGNITTRVAAAAAPNNGDVGYVALQVHPDEGSLEDVTGLRFRLFSGNEQYLVHGCYPTSFALEQLNAGQVPMVSLGYGGARFAPINDTFPDTASHNAKQPTIVGGGQFVIEEHGTATRTLENLREFSMNVAYQSVSLEGSGGQGEHQVITGARRISMKTTITCVFDAQASGTRKWQTYWDTAESSRPFFHALYEFSIDGATPVGKAVAIYFQRLKLIGMRPINTNVNGLNRVRVQFAALTNSVTTTDRQLAPWILAMG